MEIFPPHERRIGDVEPRRRSRVDRDPARDSGETRIVVEPQTSPDPVSTEPLIAELADAIPASPVGRFEGSRRWALRLVPLLLLAAAGGVLWREFHHLSLSAVAQAMNDWGHPRILLALLLSGFSFFLMGVVEWLGVRWAGARVP